MGDFSDECENCRSNDAASVEQQCYVCYVVVLSSVQSWSYKKGIEAALKQCVWVFIIFFTFTNNQLTLSISMSLYDTLVIIYDRIKILF